MAYAGPPVFPGPIEDALFIYHPPSKSMLLVGGTPVIQDSVKSDVWKWNGKKWTRIVGHGPGARVFFQGALNTKTNNIMLFAGAGLARINNTMGDLWSFNGSDWSSIANNDIGTHDHHKMVYVDHIDAFILYGGNKGHSFDTTTWLMRNGQFTALNIPGPGIRYQTGMVYDKHRKKLVLYGGGEKADELWEFDGSKWERVITNMNPGIKLYHHMVYDENRKAVVLHGGLINHYPQDVRNHGPAATWVWDGNSWRKIAEERIYSLAIGYHPGNKSVLAYGYDEPNENLSRRLCLWELKNEKWKKIADYGTWNTIAYLEKHLEQQPADLMALYIYAGSLTRANRIPEAEATLKKLEHADIPQKVNVWNSLIKILLAQSKLSEAGSYIFKLERSGLPRSAYISAVSYYNLACGYAKAGNKGEAFRYLYKSVALGYDKKTDYEADTDLASLKTEEEWKNLLMKLK
jgi:hypothetical protein